MRSAHDASWIVGVGLRSGDLGFSGWWCLGGGGRDSAGGTSAARLPPRRLALSQRNVAVPLRFGRPGRGREVVGRERYHPVQSADCRAVLLGEPALGRCGYQRPEDRLVPPHCRRAQAVAGKARLAPLRRGRPRSPGVGERSGGRPSRRRLHALRAGHYRVGRAGPARHDRGPGVRSRRSGVAAGQTRRSLVHPDQRHLADRLARSTTGPIHQRLAAYRVAPRWS
jgi:hypothetical protein